MPVIIIYTCVPLLLITIIAFQRQPNKLQWLFTILSFGSVILYLWATARWEMVSFYLRDIFIVLYLMACFFSFVRIKKQKPNKVALILSLGINTVLIFFFTGLNWFSLIGYISPDHTVNLKSPFRSDKQIVLNGGSSPFTNGHYHSKVQKYALDIVGLNKLGRHSYAFSSSSNLNDYVIYAVDLYSPIEGTVTVVVDKFEDLIPPTTDTKNLAGNHIVIENNGIKILLAHLKAGSAMVKVGDFVTTDSILAQVGNTGNTSEPHLHIHLEKGGNSNSILTGKSIAFTINNEFLARGDIINSD